MLEKEKVILVGVELKEDETNFEYSMEELKNLADANNLEAVSTVTQKLDKIHPSFYIGKGKLEEVGELITLYEADGVIFNDELSPSQIKNIERILSCPILDRTMLILDIFAERAKTKEARLQVEIGRLQYMLPRLVGLRQSLGRQGGGSGLKNRGAGETKLELDRRKIEDQIVRKEKELAKLVEERKTRREKRQKEAIKTVALVGYTNAGKSTLMNKMLEAGNEDKQVFAKDMLFATLETRVRHIPLGDRGEFLLTDTVGFVDKLPHHLVKAFRSTLEEVKEADLLLHVIDYSSPFYESQIKTTLETLEDIGVRGIPMIYLYNKGDLRELEIPVIKEDRIYMSAKEGIGLEGLLGMIEKEVFSNYVTASFLIPFHEGGVTSYLNTHYKVLETDYKEEGVLIRVELPGEVAKKYAVYKVEEGVH